ncbi:MAG: GNAT family N-acetyltransferase [Halobacteriota archaeon]
MPIDIEAVDDGDEWNEYLQRSAQATPFHRFECLETIADHADARLYPYVGFKGREPVGLFPIFEVSKGPISVTFSPPPDLKISYLGPASIENSSTKRRRAERTNKRLVNGCLDRMNEEINPSFTFIRPSFRYTDPRPFIWQQFDPTTRYTYVVDLTPSTDELLMGFSSDARRNVTNADEDRYVISEGDRDDVIRSIERTKQRHDEQGVTYQVTPQFVADMYDRLPDCVARVYVCTVDDEFHGGHITLEFGDVIYGWQSWGDHESDLPVNDLLEWRIMRDAKERGFDSYDLVGANNERLSEYKAKFGPKLEPFVPVQRGTQTMNTISKLYKRFR